MRSSPAVARSTLVLSTLQLTQVKTFDVTTDLTQEMPEVVCLCHPSHPQEL